MFKDETATKSSQEQYLMVKSERFYSDKNTVLFLQILRSQLCLGIH